MLEKKIQIFDGEEVVAAPSYRYKPLDVAVRIKSLAVAPKTPPGIGPMFDVALRMSREKAVELAGVLLQEALRRG
jgi:hypothetical protein